MKAEYTVDCALRTGDVPRLCHGVMGNAGYNLLRAGVRLQRTLEGLCEEPLLRRVMDTMGTGIGIDGACGVYAEDEQGNPRYDFTFFDQIVDVIAGPRSIPFMGIGFMPAQLSAASEDRGAGEKERLPPEAEGRRKSAKLTEPWMKVDRWPPKDYGKWHAFVGEIARHCVQRYGAENVSRWYWDFWNEPDLRFYWLGSEEELFMTYDHAAAAIREVLPQARVGGIGTAGGARPAVFKAFLDHCTRGRNGCTGGRGAPLDFITLHVKGGPTGAKGIFHDPWSPNGCPVQNPSLAHIIDSTREALDVIGSVEGTEGLPVFLTECDIDWGTGTSIYRNPNMHYRNSEYFPSFQAAMFRRMLDLRATYPRNPIQRLFMDTFYFPGYRVFEGQRTLITGECIDKPILNGLRVLGKLGTSRLSVSGDQSSPVEIVATATPDGSPRVMAVNFGESFGYNEAQSVCLSLRNLASGRWKVSHFRIDRDRSNAYTAWLSMQRPIVPTDAELAAVQARMGLELLEPEFSVDAEKGAARVETVLPPHSVSLWCFDPAPKTSTKEG